MTQSRPWGRLDTDTLSVETHDNPEQGDVDLIDLATVQVLAAPGSDLRFSPHISPYLGGFW
jgi:hypothetical protein